MEEFVKNLAQLCNEHKASLWYSTDDDGVLISIGDQTISIGWPSGDKPGDEILNTVFPR